MKDISFVKRHRASSSSSTQSQPHRFLRKIKKLFNSIGNIIEKKKSFESPPQQQESAKGKKNVEHVVHACVEKIIQEGYLPSEVPYTDTIRNIDTDEDVINRIEFYMNNINIKIREQSKEYKLIIREEIKNHAVFLKFECITLRGCHLLSIHLQFTHQGKITNRMLGILQPGYDCSAQKLEDFIQRKLEEIDLKPENIICAIVSDGNLKLEESHENYADEGYWYLPESKFLNIENVLQALHTLGISTSLCPLDALQFVMYDTIQTIDDMIILKTRYVAEKLKSLDKLPKDMTYITDESQYDWGQICKLLKDITTLQQKCKEHNFTDPDLLLNKQQWDVISDANKILNNEALLELLNREYLVFGDYYEKLMHHAEKIDKQGLCISDVLSRNLKKRANDALENTIFLAQLFFDSRFKNILNADQELFATEQLKKIWLQLAQITGDSELKRIDIVDKVRQFNSTSKIQKDESLQDYWDSKKGMEPELYKLAATLISIPICRRKELSENVKFLLDPTQEDITEDIVFVRCFKMFNKT
ncbi:hypothetical protein C0J52_22617 [Blattella germanica]|nr:hypothetical protein C0J52_22617 [Blattella germanica]